MVRHIDLLRKPQAGTIAKYRNMTAAHIDGSDLGKTPVDKVLLDLLQQILDFGNVDTGHAWLVNEGVEAIRIARETSSPAAFQSWDARGAQGPRAQTGQPSRQGEDSRLPGWNLQLNANGETKHQSR